MVKKQGGGRHDQHQTPVSVAVAPTDEDLFSLYLSLTGEQRRARFATTAQAAKLVGRTQRTVQFWIDHGRIGAMRVGKIYEIDLDSLRRYLRSQLKARL